VAVVEAAMTRRVSQSIADLARWLRTETERSTEKCVITIGVFGGKEIRFIHVEGNQVAELVKKLGEK
jgi:hypothetical protein